MPLVESQTCVSLSPYPVGKLLVSHESLETWFTFTIPSPHPLPGCVLLIAIFVTRKAEDTKCDG